MRRKPNYIITLWFLAIVLLLGIVVYSYDKYTRPMIRAAAIDVAQSKATMIINDSVVDVLNENNIKYDNLVKLSYDDENTLQTLQTETVYLNRLKGLLNRKIIKNVNDFNNGELKIRLGSLHSNEFLTGRGPNVTFKYDLAARVESEIVDKFVSAGINQTKHQLKLRVKTKISILIPMYSTFTEFETDVLLDEAIIIGKVPDTYANIDLANGTLYSTKGQ